ncbi:OmpA family protein [Amycolatopsis sp. cg5]|uniref:OmpA family protein n=1 Tax=Amycolatopsis sp. cg5 TaxID=3238802 RepID=UPI00352339EF
MPLALVITGVLAGGLTLAKGSGIENDLADRARAALQAAGINGGQVTFDGRAATLSGFPAERVVEAKSIVREIDGVSDVTLKTDPEPTTPPPAPPSSGSEPAPPPPAPTTSTPVDEKAALQAEIDQALAEEPITFVPDEAAVTSAGQRAAKKIAELLKKAPPDAKFEVGGHAGQGPGGEKAALKLSQDRARNVARLLIRNGIPTGRVTSKGFGDTQPSGDERRVEITVR